MSIRIPCPNCGPRPIQEFVYGEIPAAPDSITDPDERNLDRAFMHNNPEGLTTERWFHTDGCRRWLTLRRDTRSDQGEERVRNKRK
ncbi:MAG: sarcosine oxidase subunit delta [Terriglobales bacterium]